MESRILKHLIDSKNGEIGRTKEKHCREIAILTSRLAKMKDAADKTRLVQVQKSEALQHLRDVQQKIRLRHAKDKDTVKAKMMMVAMAHDPEFQRLSSQLESEQSAQVQQLEREHKEMEQLRGQKVQLQQELEQEKLFSALEKVKVSLIENIDKYDHALKSKQEENDLEVEKVAKMDLEKMEILHLEKEQKRKKLQNLQELQKLQLERDSVVEQKCQLKAKLDHQEKEAKLDHEEKEAKLDHQEKEAKMLDPRKVEKRQRLKNEYEAKMKRLTCQTTSGDDSHLNQVSEMVDSVNANLESCSRSFSKTLEQIKAALESKNYHQIVLEEKLAVVELEKIPPFITDLQGEKYQEEIIGWYNKVDKVQSDALEMLRDLEIVQSGEKKEQELRRQIEQVDLKVKRMQEQLRSA